MDFLKKKKYKSKSSTNNFCQKKKNVDFFALILIQQIFNSFFEVYRGPENFDSASPEHYKQYGNKKPISPKNEKKLSIGVYYSLSFLKTILFNAKK